MARVIILFLFSILNNEYGWCQEKSHIHYDASIAGGVLLGARGSSFEAQTIQGLRYKGYHIGAGVGIDNYYMKSFPLFAAFRKDILKKKQTPFIYFDAGINLPGKEVKITDPWINTWYSSETSNGSYYDGGIGFSAPLKGKLFFLAALGYTQKQTIEDRNLSGSLDHYEYVFRRYSMKVGLNF
jgi:hypothetical protein